MSGWIFFVLVATLFFAGIILYPILFRIMHRFNKINTPGGMIVFPVALIGMLAVAFGSVLLWPMGEVSGVVGIGRLSLVLIASLIAAVATLNGLSLVKKIALLCTACVLGTYCMPITDGVWEIAVRFGCVIGWMIFVLAFQKMDKIAGFSVNAALSFFTFVFLLALLFHKLPYEFGALAVVLWFLTFPVNAFVTQVKLPEIRQILITPIGFLWGFFLVYAAVQGMAFGAVVSAGYYIFEFAAVAVMTVYQTHRVYPLQADFMTQSVAYQNAGQKLNRFITLRSALFGALGVVAAVAGHSVGAFGFLVFFGIAYIDMYRRLSDWNAPKVRLRDLFSDLKNGFKELGRDLKRAPLQKSARPKMKMRPATTNKALASEKKTPVSAQKGQANQKKKSARIPKKIKNRRG